LLADLVTALDAWLAANRRSAQARELRRLTDRLRAFSGTDDRLADLYAQVAAALANPEPVRRRAFWKR
jgi:seryl-tRNA(Sec) selenium transferase